MNPHRTSCPTLAAAALALSCFLAAGCHSRVEPASEEQHGSAAAAPQPSGGAAAAVVRWVADAVITENFSDAAPLTAGAARTYVRFFDLAEALLPPGARAADRPMRVAMAMPGVGHTRSDGSIEFSGVASYVNAAGRLQTFSNWVVEPTRPRRTEWRVTGFHLDGNPVARLVPDVAETEPVVNDGVTVRLLAGMASPAHPLSLSVIVTVANRSMHAVTGERADLVEPGEKPRSVEFAFQGRPERRGDTGTILGPGRQRHVLLQWSVRAPVQPATLRLRVSAVDHHRTLALHMAPIVEASATTPQPG